MTGKGSVSRTQDSTTSSIKSKDSFAGLIIGIPMIVLTETNLPRAIFNVVLWPSFVRKGSQYLIIAGRVAVGFIEVTPFSLFSVTIPDKVRGAHLSSA
jgi:hypothetical protein